jgi:hypothetical protein
MCRAPPHQVYPELDGRQKVPQVVREDGDDLFGGGESPLRVRLKRDLLG